MTPWAFRAFSVYFEFSSGLLTPPVPKIYWRVFLLRLPRSVSPRDRRLCVLPKWRINVNVASLLHVSRLEESSQPMVIIRHPRHRTGVQRMRLPLARDPWTPFFKFKFKFKFKFSSHTLHTRFRWRLQTHQADRQAEARRRRALAAGSRAAPPPLQRSQSQSHH